ncbi:hypothetical protein BH23BAC2_BH23BAC2_00950 [soil metagenome]
MESHQFTQLPVYLKALEIFKVSRGIAHVISEKPHVIEMAYSSNPKNSAAGDLVSHSLNLIPQLAALQNSKDAANLFRGARQVRKSARFLLTKCRYIEKEGLKEKEFLRLLRNEIKVFDQLFREWFTTLQVKHNSN